MDHLSINLITCAVWHLNRPTPHIFMKKFQPILNTACLVQACKELGIAHTFYDNHHNLVGVHLDREYFFANGSTPFNDEAVGKICKDKEFTYRILNSTIRMPRTAGFIDPKYDPGYEGYVNLDTQEHIVSEIEEKFSYPLIIKMNSGSRGIQVFKCQDRSAVARSLSAIFNKASQYYDYVAIAQEYIRIKHEYRVIILNNKIVLAYEKDFSQATCGDNISPLHQDNSRAILISGAPYTKLLGRISQFIAPLFQKISIGFAGLDIVTNTDNEMYRLEINSKPGFEYFVRDNGIKELVKVYRKMLKGLKGNKLF